MIPKIIHYCWFGGNTLPNNVKNYIETWKKYCPDYTIKEWNESNFDINENNFCREAYKSKKWAFVSDYARMKILFEYGGIYLDTDVEVCKSFNDILIYDSFWGFETDNYITTGVIAAKKGNVIVGLILDYYENTKFDMTPNPVIVTNILAYKFGIVLNNKRQFIKDMDNILLPIDYFCAKNLHSGKIEKTYNTYTIHHYDGSWLNGWQRIRHKVKVLLIKFFGEEIVLWLRRMFLN